MMKLIMYSVLGVIGIGTLVLGFDSMGLSLRGLQKNVQKQIGDLKSDDQHSAELQVSLSDFDKNIQKFAADVTEIR